MRKLIDCHIHTQRCGHASGTVDDCVAEGVRQGLYGMVITEHLALPDDVDPGHHLSMPACDLEDYLVEVDIARNRYPEIALVTGLEADYLAGREQETASALAAARQHSDGARFVLGSVHFIGDWAFDDPHNVEEWDHRDVDAAWHDYFGLWVSAVKTGLFDVMAHPDLVKKFGHFPTFDPREIYSEAAAVAAQAGVLIEVSTAGLRKPVAQLYPGPQLLKAFNQAGVAATVGSDAHEPSEVGFQIDLAYDALAQAGYASVSFPDGSGGWKELEL
ncbi:MAG: histidinol-phosphatase HisJ family protein [Coriobacteriia bacterium]|nr:histidinol-phosphatase HisJ family protein [Coriobacteriia bacterium]